MKTNTLMFVGISLATAFVVYKVLENRDKSNSLKTSENATSEFAGGCTCADGTTGYCAGDCAICCARKGGIRQQVSRFDNSEFCGCGA